MPLKLHNTLTRRKEEFLPLDPNHVRMYVCGNTVYDLAHIGNARPVIVFDVLNRLLRRLYPRVTFVRNVTDVDDKIIKRSREAGEPIERLTERTTTDFQQDMRALGALEPDVEPRATQHIPQMIGMIEALIAKGHAYAADGHVLFSVPSMADYGQLSRHSRDELIAGARVDVAPYKKDPADFVLWKPSDAAQPGWDSPWGRGRPGWHIECSAMAKQYLGPVFDIHGGGQDLIFPHHENEIAQSRCAHGTPFMARTWLHNGMLTLEDVKMSKSLGNFFTVRDLLKAWPGEVLRYYMLTGIYRQPLSWTRAGLVEAKTALDRLYTALRSAAGAPALPRNDDVPLDVLAALEDDLNTPLALSHLHEQATALNKATKPAERAALAGKLRQSGALLGLLGDQPDAWFQRSASEVAGLDRETIDGLIADRLAARKAKNFREADRIRAELAAKGVALEDGPEGTTWKMQTAVASDA
ncbi:MAG: cysteine--tRNA ligase [Proteobacteria bacterium]|nr:cysteine--tRNA ligase [Pseudomonadota bacterium]MBI3497763.1 cysteine--tRNA ligase [Pseudomonadota bacterium]